MKPGALQLRMRTAVSGTGLALALVGAVAFSGKAVVVKLAYRWGAEAGVTVDAVTLLMWRMLLEGWLILVSSLILLAYWISLK